MITYDIALGNPPFKQLIEGADGFLSEVVYDLHIKKAIKNKSNKQKINGPFVLPFSVLSDSRPKVAEFKNWLHSEFGLKTVLKWEDRKAIVIGEQGYKGEVSISNLKIKDINIDTEFYNWANDNYKINKRTRQHRTSEYFTPLSVVMSVLDTLPPGLFRDNSIKFADTSAGEGVWLLGVALKRMQYLMTHKEAIGNLKAIELLPDNVENIISRLAMNNKYCKQKLAQNVVCADWLAYE